MVRLLLVLLTLAVAPSLSDSDRTVAQSRPALTPSAFEAVEWRNVGPNRGGRSIAVAGTTSRPFTGRRGRG
jgi:hypothetical protein